jgi:cytochrome P450
VRLPDDWCEHHFDHLASELGDVLNPTLARMRELCPVAHSDQHGGFWVVTDYADVLAVAQDWETFSSAQGLNIPQTPGVVRNLPVEVDPPEQRIYKRIINPYFTPAAVSAWEDGMRALVRRLADAFLAKGECDFMNDFARPFPALGFFEFAIGAPADEIEHVAYLASKSSTPKDPKARECWQGLYEWIDAFTTRRRNEPGRGDVVDAVNGANFDGRPLTQDEIIGLIQLLVLGGLETTAGALGQIFERLAREPELADHLRGNPELIPSAIEELLRLGPPFIAVARTATRDTELGGRQIKAGDKVLISFASANYDSDEFVEAENFDLDRQRNRHLSFGLGPHRCAGSNLARMNLRIALEELLPHMRDIAFAPGAEIHWHSTLTRSPLTLPLTFTVS